MLGTRLLFILLPLVVLVNGQSGSARDWRFRRPSRFPTHVVPRPSYVSRPTTFAPRPEITTEVRPHETVSTTHWPSSTYSPPVRHPSFNRRPNIVWSRPFIASSPKPKPSVTVVVLPGSHSHVLPTSPRPYYVYPEKPTSKPIDIPLAPESDLLYSKPESQPLNEPDVSSSSKPVTGVFEPELKPSPKPETEQPSINVEPVPEPPKPEVVVSRVPEPQPEVKPESEPIPHVENETSSPEPKPQPDEEPRLKPQVEPRPETEQELSPGTPEPQVEPRPEPQVEPKPEPQVVPIPEPQVVPIPEPQVVPIPEPELEPKPQPEEEPKPEPPVVTKPEPEYSPQPIPEVTSEGFDEVSPGLSSFSKPVFESESSSKPSVEPVQAEMSSTPYATVPPNPSRESSTPGPYPPTPEALSEPELLDHSEVPSNPIRLRYIPGIGNSRNPISATWSKPSWFPKPSKTPEHPNPWKPTSKPIFHLPSRTSTIQPQTRATSPKPVNVPARPVPTARTPSYAFDAMALMDYQCHEPNGYFAVPTECDAFIECKSNRARQINCPDGLHFNPKAVWPEYPCAYPSEVQCAAHYAKQAPRPTAECPRQYGYFASPSGDCGQYIMCLEGKATKMTCPPGLAFNLKTTACDWPANVPSCNPVVFRGFTCPVTDIGENGKPSDLIYKYRYGKSCKKYIACQRGSPRLLSCDEGLSYDEASQNCIDDEFVKDCS
ncbi:proline-rich extensin-like protein EPR1 [Pieris rapae]|uniref:proline-rich extensin-like protein EPR1 n=1 Tax=Pieris rapae TaxID=64459 RepID=UPI001E27D829|nr:proline-rich extensin-like protein EPR1 [Pieris rapae]